MKKKFKELTPEENEKNFYSDEEFWKRARCMWECVRRNQDYLNDFQKYGEEEFPDEDLRTWMLEKWGMWERLIHPNKSFTPNPSIFPLPDSPSGDLDYWGKHSFFGERPLWIKGPGESLTTRYTDGRVVERKFENWAIYDQKKKVWEDLNIKNCPRYISIKLEIDQYFPKTQVEDLLLRKFEEGYQKVIELQKIAFPKRFRRPRLSDEADFNKLMKVYDLRSQKKPWSEIAEQVIENSTFENPNKRSKKKRLVYQWAVDKVRDYNKTADNLINKGGWKKL